MDGDRITGKESYIRVLGTILPMTKATWKTDRTCAEATDSADYDPDTRMIYETQIPVKISATISVEGRYRRSVVPTVVTNACYSGIDAVPCVFGQDNAGNVFGHGNFDITSFEADVPYDDVVTFTAELKLNGKFYPNS